MVYEYRAHCHHVVDGDTIDTVIDLGFSMSFKARIRLAGVDTPEKRGKTKKIGLKATDFTKERVEGKDIIIQTHKDKKGKYGRIMGTIMYKHEDGTMHNLNLELIQSGNAKPYFGGNKEALAWASEVKE